MMETVSRQVSLLRVNTFIMFVIVEQQIVQKGYDSHNSLNPTPLFIIAHSCLNIDIKLHKC